MLNLISGVNASAATSKAAAITPVLVLEGHLSSLWRSRSAPIGAPQLIRIQWFSVLRVVSRVDACFNTRHPAEGWRSPHGDL